MPQYLLQRIFLAVLFMISMSLTQQLKAAHEIVTTLGYNCIDSATHRYEITLDFYRDCNGAQAPSSISLRGTAASGSNCTINTTLTLANVVGSPINICSGLTAGCNGSNYINIEHYTYKAIVTLSTACGPYTFVHTSCCNSAAYTNIFSPNATGAYTAIVIDPLVACNSTVNFGNEPVLVFSCGGEVRHNINAFDPDGDSLKYTLVAAQDIPNGTPLSYVNGLSPTHPIFTRVGTTFDLDSLTGEIRFEPLAGSVQYAMVVVRVDEIRNGVIIASTRRSLVFNISICSNHAILLDSVILTVSSAVQYDSTTNIFTFCPNAPLSFDTYFSNQDSNDVLKYDSIKSTILSNYPLATVKVSYPNLLDSSRLQLMVSIPSATAGNFTFHLENNYCNGIIGHYNFLLQEDRISYTAPSIIGCDSVVWRGNTYYQSVVDTQFTTLSSGCDSLTLTSIEVNYTSNTILYQSACDSFLWQGQYYANTGVYQVMYTNIFGCDSTLQLNLTVNNSSRDTLSITACDSYSWQGQIYTNSGFYQANFTNIGGCDSIKYLDLIVNQSIRDTTFMAACDSAVWQGQTYYLSGIYSRNYSTTSTSCDSIKYFNLTIGSQRDTTIHRACQQYSWQGQIYTNSGLYQVNNINVLGCDSVLYLDLTIDTVDLSIQMNNDTLQATVIGGASYQWIDCNNGNTNIVGATAASYTPTISGRYRVIIVTGTCVRASACQSVIITNTKVLTNNHWTIFPNPTTDFIAIQNSNLNKTAQVQIIDNLGRIVLEQAISGSENTIDLKPLSTGIYYLLIQTDEQEIQQYKVVKQ